ncbi:MAG: septation protein IspZ [Gammaproteobacteria bacterium]|nr:septation protein IspZ [Gammaproteobacteria bacterium]
MQALVDLLPLVAFAVTYWITRSFQSAIVVIMIAMTLQVVITWLIKRTVSRMLLASAVLVVGLGGVSLLLNNELIFKWKPTVLNWLFAAAFLGSRFIGDRTLAQRIMDSVARDEFQLSRTDWHTLNLMWVAFFLVSGAANIFVAYRFPEDVWVNFKLFGLTGMTLAFALVQGVWLSRRSTQEK